MNKKLLLSITLSIILAVSATIAFANTPNQPPVIDVNGSYSGVEGSPVYFDITSYDPDGDTLTYSQSFGDGWIHTGDDLFLGWTYKDGPDTFDLCVSVEDPYGGESNECTTVEISNATPVVNITNPLDGDLFQVGTDVNLSADFTDPGILDTHTCQIDWGPVTSTGTVAETDGSGTCDGSYSYSDAGVYNVEVTVTDNDGSIGQDTVMLVIYDPAGGFVTGGGWIDSPYGALRLPTDLPFFEGSYYEFIESPLMPWVEADGAASAATLEGCAYPHLVTITSQDEQDALYDFFDGDLQGKWYGGFQNEGEIDPAAGWNWVTGETWDYTNWAPGEPNDADGPGSEPHLNGWGGGWAWNDEGDLDNVTGYLIEYENCGPTGKATFGFVSKYKKGSDTPTGNTEFQFHAGDLNFHSTSYEWLVVTGSDYAKFKGNGTINGEGDYKFKLWAGDDDPDTFRIKIWTENSSEVIVYDNGFNQAIEGGSIVIHTKK